MSYTTIPRHLTYHIQTLYFLDLIYSKIIATFPFSRKFWTIAILPYLVDGFSLSLSSSHGPLILIFSLPLFSSNGVLKIMSPHSPLCWKLSRNGEVYNIQLHQLVYWLWCYDLLHPWVLPSTGLLVYLYFIPSATQRHCTTKLPTSLQFTVDTHSPNSQQTWALFVFFFGRGEEIGVSGIEELRIYKLNPAY